MHSLFRYYLMINGGPVITLMAKTCLGPKIACGTLVKKDYMYIIDVHACAAQTRTTWSYIIQLKEDKT